jgi:hypothetical protein
MDWLQSLISRISSIVRFDLTFTLFLWPSKKSNQSLIKSMIRKRQIVWKWVALTI